MKSRIAILATLALLSTAAVVAIATSSELNPVSVSTESGVLKNIREQFQQLIKTTAPERVYVQTDKSLYRAGETIWFTAYVRNETDLRASTTSDILRVELINPKGSKEAEYKLVATDGAAQGDFAVTNAMPGGIYKLRVFTNWQQNDTANRVFEKEITVQRVVAPRLKMKLEFQQKAYGKGDVVKADLTLTTNENKPLAQKPVSYKGMVSGAEFKTGTTTTNENGKAVLELTLPKDLKVADGTLNALIEYDGLTESVSRSIPIVLNQISLQFMPEGGELVAGFKSRVAFRAANEFGKAADVEGDVLDAAGNKVAHFSSFHFGMGAFEFTPKKGERYTASISRPAGISETFVLPEVAGNGYLLGATMEKSNLKLRLVSPFVEALNVLVQVRGNVVYSNTIKALKGENQLMVDAGNFPIGVAQITLFDSRGLERCERLLFVNRDKQLKISVQTDKTVYQPREKVNMTIRAFDENGLAVPGVFSMSVVDDNLLAYADDKQGHLLSKMLLEPELRETVEEPNFYFDAKEQKSQQALDLLMMTSGWRKFGWKRIMKGEFSAMYAAEKATLSGTVYNGNTGKPLAGATLRFTETNLKTMSDKDGHYEFKRLDLTANKMLEVTAKDLDKNVSQVYEYNTQYDVWLHDYRRYYRYEQIPMAAEGAAGGPKRAVNKGFDDDKLMLADVQVQEYKVPLIEKANADPAKQKDVALVPPPADMEEEVNENEAEPDMNTIVLDAREAMFKKERKPAPVSGYYRTREFPKVIYKNLQVDSVRTDYRSTIYWNGNITTDKSGRAQLSFYNSDAVTSYRAMLEGFGDDGSIGRAEVLYNTNLPLTIDAKMPVELVVSDRFSIPLVIKNNSGESMTGSVEVEAPRCIATSTMDKTFSLQKGESKVVYIQTVASQPGEGVLVIRTRAGSYVESLTKEVTVVPKGFPATVAFSGQDLSKDFSFTPSNVVPATMKATLTAYPNILTQLMSGVESILREPYGCFEQTSSSNYPNIIVLDYLRATQQNKPELEARAMKLLDDGYKKLVAFETKENGYEWFGAAPAHEALTAYGLMEFVDMKRVYPQVNNEMIQRTRELLMNKRDGNGGFKRNGRALDSFGAADEDITNAYIVYAMSEAGEKDIDKELRTSIKQAKEKNDAYLLSLVANAAFNLSDAKTGDELLQMIYNQKVDGGWTGKRHSITRSTGKSLAVETTGLALLAMMKSKDANVPAISDAVKFITASNSGHGGFGSTQATILALKALTKFAEYSKRTDESGVIEMYVSGKKVAEKAYAKGETNNVVMDGLEKFIGSGKQNVSVKLKGAKNALPYALAVSWSTSQPPSSKECAVGLETSLATTRSKVGETIRMTATVSNKTNNGQPMTMAIIGIPAGCTVSPQQLKELMEKGVVDFYEISGSNLAFYYRDLAPGESKNIPLDLKAEVTGEFEAQASSAYLYYTAEHKTWKALQRLTIE